MVPGSSIAHLTEFAIEFATLLGSLTTDFTKSLVQGTKSVNAFQAAVGAFNKK
jgi:hypothetical protein